MTEGSNFFRQLTETLSGPIVNAALQNTQYFTFLSMLESVFP